MNESDRTPDDPRDAAWQAVARSLAGESTPEQDQALRREMAEHPGRAELVAALDGALAGLRADARPEVDVEAALASVMARRDRPALTVERGGAAARPKPVRGLAARSTPPWWRGAPVLRVAAAVLVLVGAALLWRALAGRGAGGPTRYATEVGARRELRLADGSRVVLGPDSRLAASGRGGRAVTLEGEAYFEVRHDPDRPFTVTTPAAVLMDIGTAFTVRADSAAGTAVAVTEGVVGISAQQTAAAETLRVGDRARIRMGRISVQRRAVTRDEVAWTAGRLSFRDAPVAEVVSELRRWYGVTLRVDPALAGRHLTADFEGQTADQAMRIVAAALGGELRRSGTGGTVVPLRGRTP